MKLLHLAHQVPVGKREWIGFDPYRSLDQRGLRAAVSASKPDITSNSSSSIDSWRTRWNLRFKIFQNPVDVFLRPLHGRKTAGVFAGKGFGAGLKQQNKEVSSDECANADLAPSMTSGNIFVGHGSGGKLVLPGEIQRQKSRADGFVDRSRFGVVVE